VLFPGLHRLSIRLRLALWFAFFLLANVMGIGVFLLTSQEHELHREVDEALALRASRVEREITLDGKQLDPADVRADLLALTPLEEFSQPGIYVQLIDHGGRLVAVYPIPVGGQLPVTAELVQLTLAGNATYETMPVGPERVRILLRPLVVDGRTIGAVLVGESLHPLDVSQRTMRQHLVVAAAAAALICLIAGWWLTGRALRPIAEVTDLARRIRSTGRFDQRIAEPPARDELYELTVTFNDMIESLDRTLARQREFVADASHELRGPLMVIRGNLQLLSRNSMGEDHQEALRDASEEVERISRLVADLLFLAEVDMNDIVERNPVALDEVVEDTWQRACVIDIGRHNVELGKNEQVTVVGDRERLGQLVWNLVTNGLRYTPTGGQITLSLWAHPEVAEIVVADTGIGIAEQHLPYVFDRFYRVDRARSRQSGSTGLGLAIVKQIAEVHGGQVRVQSVPGKGSTFTVALPRG